LPVEPHQESECHLSESNELPSLSLSGLQHRCIEESERFFRRQSYDPRFCFELFRRAVLEHDQRAWEMIHRQYYPLVLNWVQRHSLLSAVDEEPAYFANRAFEKMWGALSPQKFSRFPDLKSILRYLQMCVHSVIVDYARRGEQSILLEDSEREPVVLRDPGQSSLEEKVFTRRQAAELWQWINERLKDDKERAVIYGSFVLDLKPAEVLETYTHLFHDVREIYTTKENVLARLRRDDSLKELVEDA
jgi:DNA-directed RNA polymerase specialized sigma24 family protein